MSAPSPDQAPKTPARWRALWRSSLARQGRPDLVRGVRAGLVVGLPLLVAVLLGHRDQGEFVALGALQAEVVDGPFPARSRVTALAWTAGLSGLAVFVGVLAGNVAALAVLATGVWCAASPLPGAFGARYEPIGLVTAILLLFGILEPGGPGQAARDAGLVVMGVGWAALVPLANWRRGRGREPARQAAALLRAVAALVNEVTAVTKTTGADGSDAPFGAALEAARKALATTRDVLSATYGAGRTDLRLVQLANACERTIVRTAAVREDLISVLDGRPAPGDVDVGGLGEALSAVADRLEAGAVVLDNMARRRGAPSKTTPPSVTALAAERSVRAFGEGVERLAASGAGPSARLGDLDLLGRATQRVADGVEAALAAIGDGVPRAVTERRTPPVGRRVAKILAPHVSWDSPRARLALRLGIMTAAAQALVQAAGISHGIWLLFALLTVLKSDQGSTWTRAVQRTLGTTLGAVVAAGAVSAVSNDLALAVLITLLTGACFVMLSVNYAYFVVLLTPLALMFGEVIGPSSWRDAVTRLVLTACGALGAVAADAVLWPLREAEELPALLAVTVRAVGKYLDRVLGAYQHHTVAVEGLVEARRGAEETHGRLRDALERLELGSRADRLSATEVAPAVTVTAELVRTVRAGQIALDETPRTPGAPEPVEAPLVAAIAAYRGPAEVTFHQLAARAARAAVAARTPTAEPAAVTADDTGTLPVPADVDAALDHLGRARAPAEVMARWHAASRMLRRVDDEVGRLGAIIGSLSSSAPRPDRKETWPTPHPNRPTPSAPSPN